MTRRHLTVMMITVVCRSTPTIDGETLYALGSDGDLVALDVKTGATRWRKSLRTDFGGMAGTWAYSESPLVDGDALVVTPGGRTALVALNKRSGDVIWRAAVPGNEPAGYASLAIAQVGGVKQYVTFLDKGIVAVDARTGALLWRDDRTAKGSAANIPTPVGDGIVYHGTALTGGAAVRLVVNQGKVMAQPLYHDRRLPGANGGSILIGGYLYGTNSQSLMCVELATGKVVWQERGIGTASLAFVNGRLYLHGENGDVALVEPTPAGYRERGRFTPPNQPDRSRIGSGPTGAAQAWSHPVVANGRLYIRDLGAIWAYDIRAGK